MANKIKKLFDDDVYSKDFRAKQFLPFNALRGFNDMIKEEEIIRVDKKISDCNIISPPIITHLE